MNLPNLLTLARIALSVLFVVALSFDWPHAYGAAFVLFLVASLTDFLDGWLARKYNLVTDFGKLMDPLADKVLVTTALVMLIPLGRVPAWLALIILCREIVITGLRGVASSSAGIVVAASGLGKIKSIIQYLGLGTLIFPLGVLPIPYLHHIGLAILYVALVITIWSGIDYFYKLRRVFLEDER